MLELYNAHPNVSHVLKALNMMMPVQVNSEMYKVHHTVHNVHVGTLKTLPNIFKRSQHFEHDYAYTIEFRD